MCPLSGAQGDGIIAYGAWCELLDVEPTSEAEMVFTLFDPPRRGFVRVNEFLLSLACFVPAARDDRLRFCFTAFDTNRDGTISREELVGILMGNLLASSEREVAKKAETIMEQADENRDGFIDYDEFARVAVRFPKICFPLGLAAGVGMGTGVSPVKR